MIPEVKFVYRYDITPPTWTVIVKGDGLELCAILDRPEDCTLAHALNLWHTALARYKGPRP